VTRERLYWPGDTHLTPAGNRFVAQVLGETLSQAAQRMKTAAK
jgi:hypothetical protein